MQKTVPTHLKSTVDMIELAFPDGVNREQYFSLLHLLYDYMCDENLSIVMSYITGESTAVVTNDIYGVKQRAVNNDCILAVKDKLVKAGFASWIAED